ncbi:MAG: 3-oxoacyl-[acyl-carrier-protein] synthase III C-terminal domain-containing protein [Dehalococcoidales bacterium]
MAGIVSYGAYIPLRRLGKGTQGWRSQNEKAVAYYDEDSLTMAVAAAIDCLGNDNRETIDGLYAASTTHPYKEKLAATTIAGAADLRSDIITMDCTDTLRAGTGALRMAADTVKAGSAKKIMVTASDCRLGPPRSDLDTNFGDGAAAFIIGNENVLATIEASYSVSNELLDLWRGDTAKFVHTWEDRWVQEEGYLKVFPRVMGDFFKKNNLTTADITKAAFSGNNPRRHAQMVKTLGFEPGQVQDPLFSTVGNTGTASALMMLVAALEDASPGDKILCASYGDGVDILLLQVTDQIKKAGKGRGIKKHLAHKMIFPSYDAYLLFHHQAGDPEADGGLSASAIAREKEAIYPLHGSKCKVCATIQYPPQRVCTNCRTKDEFDRIRLSDKKAVIFTRVLDYAAPVPGYDSPGVDLLIDWEGGGRANFALTDKKSKPEDIPMGMKVEMTFRKLRAAGGIHHYFWKAMPLRESWIHKEES